MTRYATATTSILDPAHTAPFLRLPLELRYSIYEVLLWLPHLLILSKNPTYRKNQGIITALSLVSRHLREEISKCLWDRHLKLGREDLMAESAVVMTSQHLVRGTLSQVQWYWNLRKAWHLYFHRPLKSVTGLPSKSRTSSLRLPSS